MEAAVSKRLKRIKTAASELHKLLNEDAVEVAARAALEAALDNLKGGRIDSGWFARVLSQLPESKFRDSLADSTEGRKASFDKEEVVLRRARRVLSKNGLDLDDLSEKLERLYTFIDNRKKSSGGNPGFGAWKWLMQRLAGIYADETGEKPSVTENEHRAETNERYSGRFVRIATLVDSATAEISSKSGYHTAPRSNSALGPALRYLLEAKRRRSKTP
jgi:hypothetical protein